MIMSGKMLFDWLGRRHASQPALAAGAMIGRAVEHVIERRLNLTPDLGGTGSTTAMAEAIVAHLGI